VNGGKYYPVKGDYIEQTYHSKFAVMQGGPSVAYKFNEQFSAGISAHFVYSMMEFSMPFGLNPSVMQGSPNNMPTATFGQLFSMSPSLGGFGYSEVIASADMSKLNVVSWGGKIGLAWKPNQTVSFGLNYTLPTTLTYKNGKATMDMSKQFEDAMGRAVVGFYSQPGTTGAPLDTAFKYIGINFAQMGIDLTQGVAAQYDLEVGMKLPQSIGLGMSYNASKVVRLSFDAEWVNWKSAFDKMEIRMTNGTSANINKMIGSTNFNYDFPLNWKDAFIVKVGGEYDVAKEVTLRLGYAYGSNPVPESTVFPVFPAIVENHLTFGGSYKFNTRMSLNLAFETALDKQLVAANPSLIQSEFSGSTSGLSTVLGHLSFNLNF
jgi:long-chain fatty acid transport protein